MNQVFPAHERVGRIHGSIARNLGVAILAGRLAPGATLAGEIEHADELNVSRSAYREAIRILVAKGLVQSRPRAGTQVSARRRWNMLDRDVLAWTFEAGPTPAFIRDLFELRLVIEPAAAAFAAQRRNGRDLTYMGHALEEMTRPGLTHDQFGAADARFHDAILLASRNEILLTMSSSIAAALLWMTVRRTETGRSSDLLDEHRRVFDAIVAGDAEQARTVTADLVRHVRDNIALNTANDGETG